jgi:KDO2-lipid IV(A) lauroyltransferase
VTRVTGVARDESSGTDLHGGNVADERCPDVRKGLLGLFRSGNFSLLWFSTLTSQLGDHLNLMALMALIFAMSAGQAKGFEFSKILLLASAPVLIFGPVSGVYADRSSRKKMMIISDLLRAGLVALIPLFAGRPMTSVYVIVFLVFTINRFYLSAKQAAIPQIVADGKLMAANSLLNVAMMATIVLGPWGGGALVARFGYTVGFLADSGTYVVSAILAAFITLKSISEIDAARIRASAERRRALGDTAKHALHAASRAELAEDAARFGRGIAAPIEEEVEVIGNAYHRLVADLRDGLARMRGNGPVMYATTASAAVMFVAGFVMVATPVFVRNEFHVGTGELGMFFSIGGIGMLLGSLVVGRFFHDAPRRAIVAASFFLAAGAIGSLSFSGSVPVLAFWIFLVGFFVAPTMVTCDTILQESMPGKAVGKAFGFRDMVSKAAFGVAGILSGIIADLIGPRDLLLVVAVGAFAFSGVSIFLFADTSKLNLLNVYPLMKAGSALSTSLPRRVSYWIAGVLSDIAFLLFTEKRRWARENIAHVIHKSPASREARDLARRMFRSCGQYWVDFFGLNGRRAASIGAGVRIEGLEHLKNALKHGKGAIFLTAHLGSWDVGGAALAATGELPELSAIVEPVTGGSSQKAVTSMRENRGLKVIPVGKPLGIGRALRRNEIVFLVGDRAIGSEGVTVEFFGEETEFPRGAAFWALRSGAPVVPGFCVRQPDGTYVGYIEEAIEASHSDDAEEDLIVHTQRIAQVIERYIARYPDQWCMLQPIWQNGQASS